MGAHYKLAKWITFKAAFGKGFKSPTYAQLYQVFTNITQGYTVDVFVKGYVLLNVSVQKGLFKQRLTLQAAIDNIGNYTDYLMPSQPGRAFSGGFMWKL